MKNVHHIFSLKNKIIASKLICAHIPSTFMQLLRSQFKYFYFLKTSGELHGTSCDLLLNVGRHTAQRKHSPTGEDTKEWKQPPTKHT